MFLFFSLRPLQRSVQGVAGSRQDPLGEEQGLRVEGEPPAQPGDHEGLHLREQKVRHKIYPISLSLPGMERKQSV